MSKFQRQKNMECEMRKREVVINRQGKIKNEDVEKLVENRAEVKASPIRIIGNNL